MTSRRALQAISFLALLGTALPAALHLAGAVELPFVGTATLVATLVWFAVTPFWMGRG
jgi:hypothetical protein